MTVIVIAVLAGLVLALGGLASGGARHLGTSLWLEPHGLGDATSLPSGRSLDSTVIALGWAAAAAIAALVLAAWAMIAPSIPKFLGVAILAGLAWAGWFGIGADVTGQPVASPAAVQASALAIAVVGLTLARCLLGPRLPGAVFGLIGAIALGAITLRLLDSGRTAFLVGVIALGLGVGSIGRLAGSGQRPSPGSWKRRRSWGALVALLAIGAACFGAWLRWGPPGPLEPSAIAFGSDGSVLTYAAPGALLGVGDDWQRNRGGVIVALPASGPLKRLAGTGVEASDFDEDMASSPQVALAGIGDLATDSVGNLYTTVGCRIVKINAFGATTALNRGDAAAGDGVLLAESRACPSGVRHRLAIGTDGTLFFRDTEDGWVYRVGVDGIMHRAFDSSPLAESTYVETLGTDQAGSVYLIDDANARLIRVHLDGRIDAVTLEGNQILAVSSSGSVLWASPSGERDVLLRSEWPDAELAPATPVAIEHADVCPAHPVAAALAPDGTVACATDRYLVVVPPTGDARGVDL